MLQHTGSIKFLLKHMEQSHTDNCGSHSKTKPGVLNPKHNILAGETLVILRFGVLTAPALPEPLSPGIGMSQPSCACQGEFAK